MSNDAESPDGPSVGDGDEEHSSGQSARDASNQGIDGESSTGADGGSSVSADRRSSTDESSYELMDDLSQGSDVSLTSTESYELLRPSRHHLASYLDEHDYEIAETTWLTPPFAYGAVLRDPMNDDYQYYIAEPELGLGEQRLLAQLERQLRDDLLFRAPGEETALSGGGIDGEVSSAEMTASSEGDDSRTGGVFDSASEEAPADALRSDSDRAREAVLEATVRNIIRKYNMDVAEPSIRKVIYYLKRDWLRYEAIDPLMNDPQIEEISCDGDDIPVFIYHRDYEDMAVNRAFEGDELRSFVTKLAQRSGKDISIARPLEGASLPNGSRIELSLGGEVTTKGSAFTIRKFKEEPFTPPDLIRMGTFTAEQMAYLWVLVENNHSGIVAGGTASGKTTTLNASLLFLPPKAKLISIEDTRELLPPQINWLPMVTREGFSEGDGGIGMMDLLRHSLRHRPEYILVGEVRGPEAHALFQAMNTGHTTFSTLHADSPRGVLNRLENEPMSVPRELVAELDVLMIQSTVPVDGERVRRVLTMNEILDLDPETRRISQRPVFEWDEATDSINQVAESRHLAELESQGHDPYTAIEHRSAILQYLADKNLTSYDDVTAVTQTYMIAPERVRSMMQADDLDFDTLRRIRKRALTTSI